MYEDDQFKKISDDYLSEIYVHFLAVLCTILSVLGAFSGGPVCRQIQKQRSTLYYRFLPLLTGQIYNLIWFYYGLLKLDWTIMISHTMGCTMQTFYMLIYIRFSNPVPIVQITCAWSLLFFGWFHLNIIIGTREKVISRLGFIGALSLGLNYLATIIDFLALECNKSQALKTYSRKIYAADLMNEQLKAEFRQRREMEILRIFFIYFHTNNFAQCHNQREQSYNRCSHLKSIHNHAHNIDYHLNQQNLTYHYSQKCLVSQIPIDF